MHFTTFIAPSGINSTDIGDIPDISLPDGGNASNVTIPILIIDDDILENTESLTITIPDIEDCTLGSPTSINLRVQDDDGMYIRNTHMQLSASMYITSLIIIIIHFDRTINII